MKAMELVKYEDLTVEGGRWIGEASDFGWKAWPQAVTVQRGNAGLIFQDPRPVRHEQMGGIEVMIYRSLDGIELHILND